MRDSTSTPRPSHRPPRLLAALLLLVMVALPPAARAEEDPPPQYTLSIEVTPTRLEIGQAATVTATLKQGDTPVANHPVSITVAISPAAGNAPPAENLEPIDTNPQGRAIFTYTGEVAGTYTFQADTEIDGTPITSSQVTAVWFQVTRLTLSPPTLFRIAGQEVEFTATAEAHDNLSAQGAKLTFRVASGPNAVRSENATADKDGKATFTYNGTTSWTGTDTDTVEVTGVGDPAAKASATVRWLPTTTRISLSPSSTTGTLGLPQTWTATVTDSLGRAVANVPVRFRVNNQHQDVAPNTDAQGEATFTYSSNRTGRDTITAYIDLNLDGARQTDEPQATATIDWSGRGGLTLSPTANTLVTGVSQTVTATLTDATGDPLPGITVRFTVTGANPVTRGVSTNASGEASLTYTGHNAGIDTVTAYADLNGNNRRDTTEPTATATITWLHDVALSLAVSDSAPLTGDTVSITGTLVNPMGPIAGSVVRFSVTGANSGSGATSSDAAGNAVFTYTGGTAGTDTVTAYADLNANGVRDTGEPSASVTITWTRPFTPADPVPAKDGCRYFAATQHNLCAGFLSYWETFGGLAVYGYPITEEFVEDGMTVQYFERARFEWHPGAWPERYDVLLGLLGNTVTEGRHSEAPFQPAPQDPACVYFPATGHNLCGGFLRYWETYGGLAVYGMPISEEFPEVNPDTGQIYTVQYFERQRFEWHPGEWPERWDVMLGRIGVQVLDKHYPTR